VVLQNRFNPCTKKFKELAENGEMGELKTARAIVTWDRSADYYNRDEWRGKWATEGGGVLINQAVHTLDYFMYILGGVKSVKAQMSNFTLEDVIEVEDTMSASLILKNGHKAVMFATNGYGKDKAPEFEAVFEKGVIRYENSTLYVDDVPVETDKKRDGKKAYWGMGHKALFKSFYEKNEYFSPRDIKDTMQTLFAMYESAKNGGCEVVIK
ncbi:MAG: Gfo/Idh/MocA family oxidoreductase, partial [Clostridia bacterium]|nr:Gfo/Idh/MocA family oxidoreductase [Clostridia bacterium]